MGTSTEAIDSQMKKAKSFATFQSLPISDVGAADSSVAVSVGSEVVSTYKGQSASSNVSHSNLLTYYHVTMN